MDDQNALESAVSALLAEPTEENLWQAILVFQGVPFYTASGLPYSYTVKIGRNGQPNRELVIDRRENSKTLTWGSIRVAFAAAMEQRSTVVKRPKALGDIRGISYIYPLFRRFGLIRVPEEIAAKMENAHF